MAMLDPRMDELKGHPCYEDILKLNPLKPENPNPFTTSVSNKISV
jgi:hypothetical protein